MLILLVIPFPTNILPIFPVLWLIVGWLYTQIRPEPIPLVWSGWDISCEEVARGDPSFLQAFALRGISAPGSTVLFPWTAGNGGWHQLPVFKRLVDSLQRDGS